MTGPRFASLAAELRERIALGDYGRTGALESEAEIGRRYEVSRVTVRRALEQLAAEGLVAARRGSGWYVTSGASFGQTLALGSFRHARSAVTEAGLPLTRAVTGYEYRPAPADVAHQLGVPESSEVLHVLSVRHAAEHPFDTTAEWVPLAFAAPVSRAEAEDPGVWETLRRHGHDIELVRQTMTATAASAAVAEQLATLPGTPVLLVRRVAVLTGGWPLALSEHRYLGHRFRLEVEFRGGPATAGTEPAGVAAFAPYD
jgi:GntR family transcriptional regulator